MTTNEFLDRYTHGPVYNPDREVMTEDYTIGSITSFGKQPIYVTINTGHKMAVLPDNGQFGEWIQDRLGDELLRLVYRNEADLVEIAALVRQYQVVHEAARLAESYLGIDGAPLLSFNQTLSKINHILTQRLHTLTD